MVGAIRPLGRGCVRGAGRDFGDGREPVARRQSVYSRTARGAAPTDGHRDLRMLPARTATHAHHAAATDAGGARTLSARHHARPEAEGGPGSPEEAPGAYKDIELVMKSQTTLVKIEGKFHPRIVRMAKD